MNNYLKLMIMTIVKKTEYHVTDSGSKLIMQQYNEKGCKFYFWRYFLNGNIAGDMLKCKPNVKRLIANY